MTFVQRSTDEPAADAEYITAVRGGDSAAYAVLYERHRAAAYHLARQLVRSSNEADDLVSEAFTKVFNTLLSGGGPDSAFRAYLLTSVRNTFYDGTRRDKKVTYTDDLEPHDAGQPFVDTAVAGLDSAMAAKAFARLPERWQTVLWHTEVEGESPAEVAPLLGLTANAAAALAYRAREGLRQAFLQEHIADVAASSCKVTTDRLGAWARGGLSKREQAQVDGHLDECDRCAAVAAEISDLGAGLRGVVAVLAIGSAPLTAAYLAGGTTAKIGALAWAGVGAPAAGFAKISTLIAAPAATSGTVITGAAATGSGASVGASGASNAAGSTSRGLIGAIAGTAAVAAIATAVIVGTNFDSPKPSAKDGGLGTNSSAAPQQGSTGAPNTQAAPPASDSANASASASPTSVESPSARTTYGGDIGALPSIPPIISETIPGLDPTIPALPSTPPPSPENPGTVAPTPTATTPAPGTSNPPVTTTPPGNSDQANPSYAPSPLNLTLEQQVLAPNTYLKTFTVTNPDKIAYTSFALDLPAFGSPPGVLLPTSCGFDVLVDGTLPTLEPCGLKPTKLTITPNNPLKPGETRTLVLFISVGLDQTVAAGETIKGSITVNDQPSSKVAIDLTFDKAYPVTSNTGGEAPGGTGTPGGGTGTGPGTEPGPGGTP